MRAEPTVLGWLLLAVACAPVSIPVESLEDDPQRYVDSEVYRRGILLRDLTTTENSYAAQRLAQYAVPGSSWEAVEAWDPAARGLRTGDVERAQEGLDLLFDPAEAESLLPGELPASVEEWVELGRRVFFDRPLRADPLYRALIEVEGGLEEVGFLRDGDRWVGLAAFVQDEEVRVGPTCAQCHVSVDPSGQLSAVLSNRSMDLGAARLLASGDLPWSLPPELESTQAAQWAELGPGRGDVLGDGVFNPYAFPDLGGLGDLPLLHHNGNWQRRGVATLAVRCETLFLTADGAQSRLPRILSWAVAEYISSLQAPPPLYAPGEAPEGAQQGEALFAQEGCVDCHVPPLYTSDQVVPLEQIGTDPSAGESSVRYSGGYRVPSLRGVAYKAPYLHHGALETLEEMFSPGREAQEPGHLYGLELSGEEREALLTFLRTL